MLIYLRCSKTAPHAGFAKFMVSNGVILIAIVYRLATFFAFSEFRWLFSIGASRGTDDTPTNITHYRFLPFGRFARPTSNAIQAKKPNRNPNQNGFTYILITSKNDFEGIGDGRTPSRDCASIPHCFKKRQLILPRLLARHFHLDVKRSTVGAMSPYIRIAGGSYRYATTIFRKEISDSMVYGKASSLAESYNDFVL
jgi:hypothetical protein